MLISINVDKYDQNWPFQKRLLIQYSIMTLHLNDSIEEFSVPVVDFDPFLNGTTEARLLTAKEMVRVMKEVGFLYVTNHGINEADQKRMFEWSEKFFKLSEEQKAKCEHPPSGAHHRGWSKIGKEKVVQMVFDEKKVQDLRKVPDMKESFECGNENDKLYYNIWPNDEDIAGFKEYCQYYFNICAATSKQLLRAIALGMGLDEEFFLPYHSNSDNQLRLLHYPPTDEKSLKDGRSERIAAHTDFGTLTMLLQDDCGGLEVEMPGKKGCFISAPTIPGSLVVNTGDFLMRWSNDQFISTLHRVTAPPIDSKTGISKVRYSIPYFVSANKDKVVDCLPGTFSESSPKKYEPITAGIYLARRLNATY